MATTTTNEATWATSGAWRDGADRQDDAPSQATSIQRLRERIEDEFDWVHDVDFMMQTPHLLLGGETPWDVLYHSPGGARRMADILDMVAADRLEALPLAAPYDGPERRTP